MKKTEWFFNNWLNSYSSKLLPNSLKNVSYNKQIKLSVFKDFFLPKNIIIIIKFNENIMEKEWDQVVIIIKELGACAHKNKYVPTHNTHYI